MRPAVFCTQVVVREHFLGTFLWDMLDSFSSFCTLVCRQVDISFLSLLRFAFCLVIVEGPFCSLITTS